MKFEKLLLATANQPVFETGFLLAGAVEPADVRRQLSRWVKAGQVIQLRRGIYSLAEPYQRIVPHPFLIANSLMPGSYVSLQSALAYFGLIPEYTPQTLSVSNQRPAHWRNALGDFRFQHLSSHLFFGYQRAALTSGQEAFIAFPEKALLDLVHLTPEGDSSAYLAGLRLQNLKSLDRQRLQALAERAGKPKWQRAVNRIMALMDHEMSIFING